MAIKIKISSRSRVHFVVNKTPRRKVFIKRKARANRLNNKYIKYLYIINYLSIKYYLIKALREIRV